MDESDGEHQDTDEERDNSEAQKAALHHTIYKLSQECGRQLETEFSRPVLAHMADLAFQMMETFGKDLELFAKHAKRTKIQPDDVRLLFRNNPDLCSNLDEIVNKMNEEKFARKGKTKSKKKRPLESEDINTEAAANDQPLAVEEVTTQPEVHPTVTSTQPFAMNEMNLNFNEMYDF